MRNGEGTACRSRLHLIRSHTCDIEVGVRPGLVSRSQRDLHVRIPTRSHITRIPTPSSPENLHTTHRSEHNFNPSTIDYPRTRPIPESIVNHDL